MTQNTLQAPPRLVCCKLCTLKWHPYSCDLSPIEHPWDELKRQAIKQELFDMLWWKAEDSMCPKEFNDSKPCWYQSLLDRASNQVLVSAVKFFSCFYGLVKISTILCNWKTKFRISQYVILCICLSPFKVMLVWGKYSDKLSTLSCGWFILGKNGNFYHNL
jgi:hypothetical protein